MKSYSRALHLEEWPSQDRRLWTEACDPGDDLLDEPGLAASWRPTTRRNVQEGYGHALFWLQRHGAVDPDLHPALRWTADRLRRYIQDMRRRLAATTVHVRIVTLEQMIKAMDPTADRSALKRAKRATHARPDWIRKKRRLRRPEELIDLGRSLMDGAETSDGKWHLRAADYRDGLIIVMLAYMPMRHRNIHSLEIGKHLVRRGLAWWIQIPGEEMKNHRPLEIEVPRFIVSYLERYLTHWRPMMCRDRYSGPALWISFKGLPMTYKALGYQVEIRTRRAFGTGIPPHAFRDAAATVISESDPENYALAASVLGHARLSTTQRYYTIAGSRGAALGHGTVLDVLRREAAKTLREEQE